MKQSELSTKLMEMDEGIDQIVNDLRRDFSNSFKTLETSNEKVALESDAYYAMTEYLIASRINSRWKKAYDNSKANLDYVAETFDIDPRGVAGQTKTLLVINNLMYTKRQNKDGSTTLVTDLVNALNRCGVDKETIDKALKMAEKSKKGNTYYNVTTVEG